MTTRNPHRLIVWVSVVVLVFGLAAGGAAWAQTAPACIPQTSVTFNFSPQPADTAPGPGIRSLASALAYGNLLHYTVPAGASLVKIDAIGGSGGDKTNATAYSGGFGAEVVAVFPASAGSTLDVVVGSAGSSATQGGGGGGGSFVFLHGGALLVAAGGGGGAGYTANGQDAQLGNDGGTTSGSGGTGGAGGQGGQNNFADGGGGGGTTSAGANGTGGNSGAGGSQITDSPLLSANAGGLGYAPNGGAGGYGGGGGGGEYSGGGGGGFSGGGGGGPDVDRAGGGGGSYVAPGATYPAFSTLSSAGDGSVTICEVVIPVTAIPTLSLWALLLLALGLAVAAVPMLVRRS